MQLLPRDNLTITTPLDVLTAKQRLSRLIETPQANLLAMYQRRPAIYSGDVIGDDLEFSRSVSVMQNRYAPFIRGQIFTINGRTTIRFEFHPNSFTQAAFLAIIAFTIGATILVVANLFLTGVLSGFILVPYVIAALLYAFHCSGYTAAVQKEKQFLNQLLLDKFEHEQAHQIVGTSQEPQE